MARKTLSTDFTYLKLKTKSLQIFQYLLFNEKETNVRRNLAEQNQNMVNIWLHHAVS